MSCFADVMRQRSITGYFFIFSSSVKQTNKQTFTVILFLLDSYASGRCVSSGPRVYQLQ